MTKRNAQISWAGYIANKIENGFYIQGKNNANYGPFKNIKYAEFFNYLAFSQINNENNKEILIYENTKVKKIKKNKFDNTKFAHPKYINFEISPIGTWWNDTYGTLLTQDTVLKLAKECGANGYEAFKNWLISGSMFNGKPIHCQLCQ